MALLDLYEGDLSLFGGHVLLGLEPPLDDGHLSLAGYDGIQLEPTKSEVALVGTSHQQLNADTDLFENFGQSAEVKEENVSNRWLDINVDLLDLLADTHNQSGFSDSLVEDSGLPPIAPPQETQLTALEVLQSLADEAEKELASNNTFSEPSSPTAPLTVYIEGEQDSELTISRGSSSVLMEMLLQDNPLFVHGENVHQQHSVMDIDVDEHLVLEASAMPILSPVSPDDVESLLSSGPCSPDSVALELSSVTSDPDYRPDNSSDGDMWLPQKQRKRGPRTAPYTKSSKGASAAKLTDRKQRKKQQNRDAALKYRQKKKAETNTTEAEYDVLEQRNTELKDKCDQMTREIKYLKDLMADVYHARGLTFKLPALT